MRIVISILYLLLFSSLQAQTELIDHKEELLLMGTRFEITAMATTKEAATNAVKAGITEIQRIEALISSWKPNSQTSNINKNAGIKPVPVDKELFYLISRAIKVSDLTQGAFDISFAAINQIYTFDKQEHQLFSSTILKEVTKHIGYQNIILDPQNYTVFLKIEGMKIGFGGIGKGYAANKAKKIMEALPGVKGGAINAAGDLMVWGQNGKENGWQIQISDPKDASRSIGWLSINEGAVVTSGDYEKYFTNNGNRYAHIINPKTGNPTTGIKSATVICPDAEIGDALATAIFVLGVENGILLINQLKGIEALVITDKDQLITTTNLQLNRY